MNDVLRDVPEAHGGLARWHEIRHRPRQIVTGGGLWALKGLTQDAAPRKMTVSLRKEFASVTPFGQPNWRTSFHPGRLAIETIDGEVVRERENPRASFDGHTMNTPWDPRFDAQQWIVGLMDNAFRVAHKPRKPTEANRSGQMMCYQNRTTSKATDSNTGAGWNSGGALSTPSAQWPALLTIMAVRDRTSLRCRHQGLVGRFEEREGRREEAEGCAVADHM